jgi:(1->4)-alpha-D-glucan 1-alpha-D-glucosylmutase
MKQAAVVPRATYRLQLHREFDFDAARTVLPYLRRLGVSHVYCSPITTARPGSLHGYDVVDPTKINPELGGREGFERFATEARALGLGILMDVVPNHMGVSGTDNPWWADVIENGRASPYAHYFDIDWTPANPALRGKLMAPVLGVPYGEALDAGQISVVLDAAQGRLAMACGPLRFPLDPGTYGRVLRDASGAAPPVLERLAGAFEAMQGRDETEPAQIDLRHATKCELQAQLARELAGDAALAATLADRVAALNSAGQRDELDALHDAQAFRLAYWRSAADDVNYRRFFDVNELAALRIEDERVFEATQGLALDLAAEGWVEGLRIDHPDGLLDPVEYLERLQRGFARRRTSTDAGLESKPLYVLVEKITAGHEALPENWQAHGTTGYEFANLAGGLLVERRAEGRMERVWRSFTGIAADYEHIMLEAKRKAAREALSAQVTTLAHALQKIALVGRYTRDHGFNSLRDALAEVAAAMPVYRTYVPRQGPASEQDKRYIDWAVARARREGDPADAALYDFVRSCLLAEAPRGNEDVAAQVRDFAMRFQQYSAPVAAKGVEDTAFYRYFRLVSLNEVGGDPDVFGISAAAFHASNVRRAANWPHSMLATSTHDNKRSEDVRARVSVLSEQPGEWKLALRRWRTATRGWRTVVNDKEAPSPADQFLLHQTLLGSLPPEGLTPESLPAYRDRIEQHMLKAAREAKLHTSWASRVPAYENALTGFVQGLLGRIDGNTALAGVQSRATELAWYGALNSLSLTLLKLTSPGVPDIYQGTELTDLSLVDPDNRRPVDYTLRDSCLAAFESFPSPEACSAELHRLAAAPTDGRLKLWLIWRLLGLRTAQPALFDTGRYVALRVTGVRRRHVVAYARRGTDATLIVMVSRKFVGLPAPVGQMPLGDGVWGDTAVQMPDWLAQEGGAQDVLTGAGCTLAGGPIMLTNVFEAVPFAAMLIPSA